MSIFLYICAAICFLSAIVFTIAGKSADSLKLCLIFYSIIFSIYLFICAPIFNSLIKYYDIDGIYPYIFMSVITSIAALPSIVLLISSFFKSDKLYNFIFNAYFLVSTAILTTITISCIVSYSDFIFLLALVPINWIFPNIILASSMLSFNVKTQRIKIFISYSVLVAASLADLIFNLIKDKNNSELYVVIPFVLIISFFGLCVSIIKSRKLKAENKMLGK